MIFVKSQRMSKPQLIEVSGSVAYIRRGVTEEVINGLTCYNYEEAELTIEEFNAYANKTLMNGQENSTNNQLAIMEAFADLYETIALGGVMQ